MRLDGGTNASPEAPVTSPPKKRTALWVGGGLLLALFLLFVGRTVYYYVGIIRGTVEPPTSFVESLTVDSSLASLPTADPDISPTELATLDDPNLGANPDDALLTIVEFADFGCPFSREASYVIRVLADHTDLVRYVYRDFPIEELHPGATLAAQAGECAQEQGRFFDYHDKLYQNQHNLSEAGLTRYAQELGMDAEAFTSCLTSGRYADEVEEDRLAGVEAGVRGTPTFYFNGARIEGAVPRNIFLTLLERFRAVQTAADSTR